MQYFIVIVLVITAATNTVNFLEIQDINPLCVFGAIIGMILPIILIPLINRKRTIKPWVATAILICYAQILSIVLMLIL
ncbi:MAG: hypothetical protein AAB575_02525 [Patescibacteria group bacterium]